MSRSGWIIPEPKASMFAWAPIPKLFQKKGSLGFAKDLMLKASVAVAPGLAFGEYGEGYIRLSCANSDSAIEEAVSRIKGFFN